MLTIFDKHRLAIARKTLKMHCTGVLIMGGMNHHEACRVIWDLTGKIANSPNDCTCPKYIKK